jgi:peptidoglycan/xylan/chitin deacetylase (PgdA/CDA1 family)
VKKRRHSLALDQYSFESSAGLFSARKVPKKPKWMSSLQVSLSELLNYEDWLEPQSRLMLEPSH